MSPKELFERVEMLQNLMVASVTGGASDNEAYKGLREDLFAIPRLKEALPRFVRTCTDLKQFWHHVKAQPNLPSYSSRREYIWEAFRPIIAASEDGAPAEREAFFAKGSEHDAYTHIRTILQQAQVSLFLIDGYMDGSIYTLLSTLSPRNLAIRILTSKVPTDFALEGTKFTKQHQGFTIETRAAKDFHDRFIVVDGTQCHLLGASITDAGNRAFTIVPLRDMPVVEFFLKHAEDVWSTAAPM